MRRAVSLLLCWIVTPFLIAPSPAQIVETPTFDVGGQSLRPPDVAAGTDGTILFSWTELASGRPAYTRRFSAAGIALGDPIRLDVTGEVRETVISARPDGTFIAAWHNREEGSRVYGRRLDATGTPVGSAMLVSVDNGFLTLQGVAGTASGSVFLWRQDEVRARVYDEVGVPLAAEFELDSFAFHSDVAALPGGGFIAVWDGALAGVGYYPARAYDGAGVATSPGFSVGPELRPYRVAVNANGDVAVVGIGSISSSNPGGVWLRRLDATGMPIANPVLVHEAFADDFWVPDVAIDSQGNVLVVWEGGNGATGLNEPARGRAFDAFDGPLGHTFTLSEEAVSAVRVTSLPNDHFVTVWASGADVQAKVTSLCLPSVTTCGDGIVHPLCEQCDDGPANSDTTPDACRTDCSLPRCGDGATDSTETCDDTNHVNCDGCSGSCVAEPGLVCGDGIPEPTCSQPCDDANAVVGDGCSAQCTIEPIPGGGGRSIDCRSTWVVDNPTNDPLLNKKGEFRAQQRCTDDDPQCDFDGGTPGSCTFRVRVCVNASGFADCEGGVRLSSWTLDRPSDKDALKSPALAAVRASFAPVPGAVVGPEAADTCSAWVSVVVPLKGEPGDYRRGKVKLKSTATQYDGGRDKDTLSLDCFPTVP